MEREDIERLERENIDYHIRDEEREMIKKKNQSKGKEPYHVFKSGDDFYYEYHTD